MSAEFLQATTDVVKVNENEYIEHAFLMGEHTDVSYFLKKDKLKAAGYSITYNKEKIKNLIDKLTEKYGNAKKIINLNFYKEGKSKEEIKKDFAESKKNMTDTYLLYDDLKGYLNGKKSVTAFVINNADKGTTNDPIAFVLYENIFTDIYIYVDLLPDKIVVIYAEHEDDF